MSRKRGIKNPKNFWDEKRINFLKEKFMDALGGTQKNRLDVLLMQEINTAFGSEFSEVQIASKRSELSLLKVNFGGAVMRSSRTKEGDARAAKKRKVIQTPDDLIYKTRAGDFKKNEMVYVPNFGVSRYDGFDVIGGGGIAGDTEAFMFTLEGKNPKRKYVLPQNLGRERIRALINAGQAREIEDVLRSPRKSMGNPMKTMTDLSDRMRSPDFRVVASVIRDALGDHVAQSYKEKAEEALEIISYEYAEALGMHWSEASERLRKIALAPKREAARELDLVNG